MITLIQRVSWAKVTIENKIIGEINKGLLLYIGFEDEDNLGKIQWSINKIINLRIFGDKEGKMNLSLLDTGGELMAISNFTLPADLNESGRRPSFTKSAKPELAETLYNEFIKECGRRSINVKAGRFGAMMNIESVANGPVNFMIRK